MDVLGEYVAFTVDDDQTREGIVFEVIERDGMCFARICSADHMVHEMPLTLLRQKLANHDASDAGHIKREDDAICGAVEGQHNQKEMDVNAYRKVTLRRPRRQKFMQKSAPVRSSVVNWGVPTVMIQIPPIAQLRLYQQDLRRLIVSDPCPVLPQLAFSQIGDQLYVAPDWKRRAGSCDPCQKRTLPRPAKTIGYLLRLGMATLGEKVVYRGGRDRIMAEGWIANNGILCARCGYVVGCTEFEKCAGMRMRKPGKHIQFADGRSLLDYSQRLRAEYL